MVTIELGGELRTLRYDFNGVCAIEERSGKGIGALMSNEDSIGFNLYRVLIWGGLRHQNPGLTVEMVGGWLQIYLAEGGDLSDLNQKVIQAMGESGLMGKKKAEGEGIKLNPSA